MTTAVQVAAAVDVAGDYGVTVTEPRVLSASNNVVVQLAPAPLVAKVAASWRREERSTGRLQRELEVARHAAGRGAAIAAPSIDPPAGPHRRRGHELTLWRLAEPTRRHARASEVAEALAAFHAAMTDYAGELPSFREGLDEAGGLLADEKSLPLLPPDDRALLVRASGRIREELGGFSLREQALHGQPHEGNRFVTAAGVLLFDFEDACRGPLEWDLAYTAGEVADFFDNVRPELLTTLRRSVSLCVAVWCWADPTRAFDVAEAARVHVRLLREAESRL